MVISNTPQREMWDSPQGKRGDRTAARPCEELHNVEKDIAECTGSSSRGHVVSLRNLHVVLTMSALKAQRRLRFRGVIIEDLIERGSLR